ncbi:hypothetical protein IL306_012415 [Fusarium sp. DS 682]|nr:hypothetical protein IL306_012415 [Fusarium sp. DS 682]
MPGKSWKEIRYECIDHIFADDDDSPLGYDEDDDVTAEIDAYEDVNHYVWPPLHHFMTECHPTNDREHKQNPTQPAMMTSSLTGPQRRRANLRTKGLIGNEMFGMSGEPGAL